MSGSKWFAWVLCFALGGNPAFVVMKRCDGIRDAKLKYQRAPAG